MMANKLLKTLVVKVLEDKQAEAIEIYNLKGKSPITDTVILCTINNSRKMDAIVSQLRKDFVHHSTYRLHHIEGKPESGWMVVDLYDVVIHLMDATNREKMNLDSILTQQVKS
jgi:ribosome-associated protein